MVLAPDEAVDKLSPEVSALWTNLLSGDAPAQQHVKLILPCSISIGAAWISDDWLSHAEVEGIVSKHFMLQRRDDDATAVHLRIVHRFCTACMRLAPHVVRRNGCRCLEKPVG